MLLLKFFLAAFLFFQGVAAQCGPPQCYNGCTDARPQVDFVFLIDVSASMQPKINGVKNGLTTFANNLDSKSISPLFSIVTFGASNAVPTRRLQLTDFSSFKKSMDSISTSGSRECGLESISTSLNIAAAGNLNINFRTGQNTKKVFILVTNEDSDQAYYSANIFGGSTQSQAKYDGACYLNSPINQADWDNSWQKEISFVANGLISADASLYMFVGWTKSLNADDVANSQTCKTPYQYCNPDRQSQSSDYKDFNAATTLASLQAQSPSQANSLQGKLLTAGKTSRCFDVADTADSTLVNNFFSQIVTDISKCDVCYSYPCSGSSCLAPVNICDCEGVPNGPKVKDSAGNCCLPSQKDCAGICNGNSLYDACGVCTPNGALYSACKLDCNQIRYLDLPPNPTSFPAYSSLIFNTICPPDYAGYLIPNADLIRHYQSTKTLASLCTHYTTYGRFESRTQCVMDTAKYAADYSVTESAAKEDYLNRLLTTTTRTAYCKDGSRFKVPSTLDSCGQCVTNLDTAPYCVKDCNGIWRKQGEPAYFVDNCGYCVAPGSNPNAKKDDCGVCDGGNALKNECLQCNGVKGLDGCNQFKCLNQTCDKQCDGKSYTLPTVALDECGICVPVGTRSPLCLQDCNHVWYKNVDSTSSPHIVDECGNCVIRSAVRLEACKQDCSGKWNGTAVVDNCQQCVVNNQPAYPCKQDCNGTYYREGAEPAVHSIDDCGNCRINATRNDDKDLCGICKHKPGYNTVTQCTPDCKGIYRLIDSPDRAFTDSCGSCWFANQTSMTNYLMDACGLCWPTRNDPGWNSTKTGVFDTQGFECLCGQTPSDCPNGKTTCNDNCPGSNLCPNSTLAPDQCGRCPTSPNYNKPKDDCGICCDPPSVPCNQDKDDCGVCFGFNKDKNNPCKICLNVVGNTCVPDCLGHYGGNATYGCDGVCNSNAACSICGNGIVETGETCDLGSDPQTHVSLNVAGSGCSPNCIAQGGNSTGSIIGGVIGGIAAIAFLALAAFLAVKYAQKAGLIGSANKQVDMGASNDNPLYKQQMAVHHNPLFES